MPVNPPTLAALMLVLILVAGCAGVQQPAPRIIVQDTQTIVRLDTDTSIKGPDDPGRYAHPAEIGVGQLQTIFDAIRIQAQRLALQKKFSGKNPQQRVFEAAEIATLAPIVKDAFSQASPKERVVFALTKPAEKGQEATVGEMYVKDQQLHFILNCYRLPSKDNEFLSACQEFARQGFALSFMEKEFFVGFGKSRLLMGRGTKELLIDFGSIPASATSGS
ncbi:MAG TPA: hypothetical protein EYO65_00175 [Nitrospirales bacterium]|nr:hypothetical protein [Nitrospirales bacterium]